MHRSFRKWLVMATSAGLAWLVPTTAHAISCGITSVVGVNFGTYDVFAVSPVDSTGSITLLCSGVQPTDFITIEIGSGSGSSAADRQMVSGAYALAYNLYLNAARTVIWGDGANGTSVLGPVSIADQTPTTWDVYGRLPAMQNVAAGTYSDTVMITVQF